MQPADYQRLKDLIDQALEKEEAVRDDYLVRVCADDASLLAEARELLAFDAPDQSALLVPAGPALPDLAGATIGRYRLLELVGEGGMGLVYAAEQQEPVRRRVALKIIKFGLDTREVITRFAAESQALARMDHPHIATVLDAGATPDGRPYFVMEYIAGLPITAYCRERALDVRATLTLFVAVCRAVHHAHQKGLIHRDLKPSNLLIVDQDDGPVPKVIDFGVARAMDKRDVEDTVCTQLGRIIGTPEYMSPEQADLGQQDIDTRSDVYSLGVVLYELLTGVLPVDRALLLRGGLGELRRHIRETEPPRPSARATTLAGGNGGGRDLRPLAGQLRGDLDWITMRALEKDRDQRYDSAAALADDLERYLDERPVLAGPPSTVYRVRKYTRRHRAAVLAALFVLAALLLAVAGTTVGMVRAVRAERQALREASRAEAGKLFQLARSSDRPPQALAYLLAALELDDRPEYRLLAERLLATVPPLRRLPVLGDSHNPHHVAFSPDGSWLAVGWSARGALQVYDRDAGGDPVELVGHTNSIDRVAFTADSRLLVTSAEDSTVRLWSPAQKSLVRTISFPGRPRSYLVAGADAMVVATFRTGEQTTWQWWPFAGGAPRDLGRSGPVILNPNDLPWPDIDPTGTWLAQPLGRQLLLHRLDDLAAPPRVIGQHEAPISGAVFAPDGRRVLSLDIHGLGILWDATAATPMPLATFDGPDVAFGATFDPPGRRLAIGGTGALRIWDLTQPPDVQPLSLWGVNWTFEAAFDPRGPWIVTTGDGRGLNAWAYEKPVALTLALPGKTAAATGFSPDGRWLVAATMAGVVQAWPLTGHQIGPARVLLDLPDHSFYSVAFDDASRHVFASVCNSAVGEGTLVKIPLAGGPVRSFFGSSCDVVVDPQGRHTAASGMTYVGMVDTQTGATRRLSQPGASARTAIGFLRDGRLLASGNDGLGIWDPATATWQRLRPAPRWALLCRDRETLVTADEAGDLWRGRYDAAPTTRLPVRFAWSNFTYWTTATDSTGTRLAAGSDDGVLEVLDLTHGVHHAIPQYDTLCWAPAIDPHGRWIATSDDGVVSLVAFPAGSSFQTQTTAAYLERVRAHSNLRAVRDVAGKFGYRFEGREVPDWDRPPRW